MNFSFYIYGTPNGYNQYPADNNSTDFQDFAQYNTAESQLSVRRDGQLVYYAYMRRLQAKTNYYLGFCLVFNGVYCTNPQKLFSLFDRAFDDVLMKGELLKFEKGKCLYTIGKFAEKQVEIERIKTFFKDYLENDFTRDFKALSPAFKVGNGAKAISVRDSTNNILDTIAEYDITHISNNEKSLSELERTHKLLTDLYAEKQKLQNNYSNLVAQKKQYKVVLFLCLIVIGCAAGLFTFNSSLKSRDSQIQNLNNTVNQQQNDIENLNQDIARLKTEYEILSSEKDRLDSEIKIKDQTILNLESQNSSYESENYKLLQEISRLSSDLKNQTYVRYQATSDADCYYKKRCESYESTNCYVGKYDYVQVYKIENGYGLTAYGWVKMSNLMKW